MSRLQARDENKYGGKWSVRKLECIEAYLDSYLKVMQNQDWAKLWYIDAFSGDGHQAFKDTDSTDETLPLFDESQSYIAQFTTGSAMRAIKLSSEREAHGFRPFDCFAFLEYNEDKLATLRNRIADDYPDQLAKCLFIVGDVNDTLPELLSRCNWGRDRAVTFIDPCATQLEWRTIESFNGTCSDVWLLFPLSSILRMLPKDGLPSEGNAKKLTKLFGESSWSEIYQDRRLEQLTLFDQGDARMYRVSGSEEVLAYATKRYESVFPEVCGYAVLKTEKNAPLFALYSMIANSSEKAKARSRAISQHLIKQLEE